MQSWDSFRYFLALYRHGRLAIAGRSLNVDHTTVSRRVKSLELTLGIKLFEKKEGGFKITTAGKNLLPYVENIEKTVLGIETITSEKSSQIAGSVRIGSPEYFGSYFLSSKIPLLLKECQNLKIDLLFDSQEESLSKRDVDIFITTERPVSGRLVVNRLAEYNTCLFATKNYFDSNPQINSVDDLGNHKLIGSHTDKMVGDAIKNTSLSRCQNINFTSYNFMAQYKAMNSGAGLCLLPKFMANEYDDLVCILDNELIINQTLWLVVHEDVRHVNRIKKTAQFISDSIHQNF